MRDAQCTTNNIDPAHEYNATMNVLYEALLMAIDQEGAELRIPRPVMRPRIPVPTADAQTNTPPVTTAPAPTSSAVAMAASNAAARASSAASTAFSPPANMKLVLQRSDPAGNPPRPY